MPENTVNIALSGQGEMAAIVGGGIGLNIAASLVWTLMGSPGKPQLVELSEWIVR